MTECVAPDCTAMAVDRHHILYAQELRRRGGDPNDWRNIVALCRRHHEYHHSRSAPLPLWVLPDSVFDFARELMGEGPAFVYLSRYYIGSDPRLDALVAGEREAA